MKDLGARARGVVARLRPPPTLLGRFRWAMLGLALMNAALVVPWVVAAQWWGLQAWTFIPIGALVLTAYAWYRTYRHESNSALNDILVAVCITLAGLAVGDPDHFGLFYTSLFFAAFYGSWQRLAVLGATYLGLYVSLVAMGPGPEHIISLATLAFAVSLGLIAGVLHYLAHTLMTHERALLNEDLLRDGATALLSAKTREEVYEAALDTMEAIVEDGFRVTVKIALGDLDLQQVVAVKGTEAEKVGETVSCAGLPWDKQEALLAGQAITIDRVWEHVGELDEILERHPLASALLITPLTIHGRVSGTMWVVSHCSIRPGLTEGAEALAAQVAMALEKAYLAESLRESESRFRHQALHDPLTDLANRTLFRERVEQALSYGKAQGVAALFLDMDDFKSINDTLGHEAGDELLRLVADRLMKALRPQDTVARLGGDEFAILLEGLNGPKGAVRVAERILTLFRRPLWLRGKSVSITMTIGIAMGTSRQAAEELLRNADVAMYSAKQRQSGTYRLFEPEMHSKLVERLGLEADMRLALETGEFTLHFQPTINLATGSIGAVETLIRWNHPIRGWVAPADFIPQAEESGLIVPIGRWVLQQACAQLAEWQRTSAAAAGLDVSVNLSARQLQDEHVVQDVAEALKRSGLAPERLILEITESALMADLDIVGRRIARLRALGVRVAIDDFGMGYSSLTYLRRFPIDMMKIDKSFVDGLERSSETEALFHAILGLAQALKIVAVAEGVEHPEQAARLAALGCEIAQGFYFSRPIDAGALEQLLTERKAARSPRRRVALDAAPLPPA